MEVARYWISLLRKNLLCKFFQTGIFCKKAVFLGKNNKEEEDSQDNKTRYQKSPLGR